MPLVQDRSLDQLTSSPAHYQCASDAPLIVLNIASSIIDKYLLYEYLDEEGSNDVDNDDVENRNEYNVQNVILFV